MASRLNLTYEIENVEIEGWGKRFENDTWTGAFGCLKEGVKIKKILNYF